ncbi:hypothetical protein H6G17_05555 [Chroococcidiopsis sp. FACHB-1243]|uniref:hypothetical protein n=1 Tax=Chroococcidiopsis sp. [FACHB-1243] TaxID=2692781 RepID=UPI001782E326|nr:hypothetical protein [Chroococcidiopsis sp. [FACHB-1243]]MBD2304980.1 hypothetical protein [Chroococcidiopsis sp. [FACHB-1243]]
MKREQGAGTSWERSSRGSRGAEEAEEQRKQRSRGSRGSNSSHWFHQPLATHYTPHPTPASTGTTHHL